MILFCTVHLHQIMSLEAHCRSRSEGQVSYFGQLTPWEGPAHTTSTPSWCLQCLFPEQTSQHLTYKVQPDRTQSHAVLWSIESWSKLKIFLIYPHSQKCPCWYTAGHVINQRKGGTGVKETIWQPSRGLSTCSLNPKCIANRDNGISAMLFDSYFSNSTHAVPYDCSITRLLQILLEDSNTSLRITTWLFPWQSFCGEDRTKSITISSRIYYNFLSISFPRISIPPTGFLSGGIGSFHKVGPSFRRTRCASIFNSNCCLKESYPISLIYA